jgi:PKD repeat protein
MVGTSTTFNGGSSIDNTGISSYQWDFGDGGTGTGVTPTHIYSSVGNYTVTLMVKDLAGNSAASSAKVTIGVVILEFTSVATMAVLMAIVSVFSLTLKRKQKLGNEVKTKTDF